MGIRLSFAAAAFLGLAGAAQAATFCVANSADLSLAFDIADDNGLDDTVQIQAGNYAGNFLYNANAAETGDLTVEGGYGPACATRSADPSLTVLDGGGAGTTLTISGNDNADLSVDGMTIRGGSSSLQGSGLDADRMINASITNNVFAANIAVSGSDAAGGLEMDRSVNVVVADNLFDGNTGGKGGGADLSDFATLLVDSNLFLGNQSEQGGGGLDLDAEGVAVVTNNVVARNSSADDAGGMSIKITAGAGASVDLTNNTVTGNTAAGDGGGISVKMIGDAASAAFYNNIVFANMAGLLGRDIEIDNDDEQNGVASPVILLNNDFDTGPFGFFSRLPIAIDPSNLANVDPLFVAPGADNYRLGAGSLLVDAGTVAAPNLPADDADGNPRVSGPGVDIGAFEQSADSDADGVADNADNCTLIANSDQRDTNGDGFGNACDPDLNNDGTVDFLDLGLMKAVFFSADPDADLDGSGMVDFLDLGGMKAFFFGPPGPSGVAP